MFVFSANMLVQLCIAQEIERIWKPIIKTPGEMDNWHMQKNLKQILVVATSQDKMLIRLHHPR
jgi:hypothetical protein